GRRLVTVNHADEHAFSFLWACAVHGSIAVVPLPFLVERILAAEAPFGPDRNRKSSAAVDTHPREPGCVLTQAVEHHVLFLDQAPFTQGARWLFHRPRFLHRWELAVRYEP